MSSHTPLENSRVKAIGMLLNKRGAWWIKTTGVKLVGCPDILACYRGYFIAIEVKREHDGAYGVTKKQQYELSKIDHSGGGWVVAVEASEVEELLDTIDERESRWC